MPKAPLIPQPSPRQTFSGSVSNTYTNRRRTHSFEAHKLRRQSSSNSLSSLNSQGSSYSQRSISESLKLLPDPRWGGGSGSRSNRARTRSNGSESGHHRKDSFSSHDGLLANSIGYGSIKDAFSLENSHHRRTPSEFSTTSFTSAVSVDTSVEPARMDPAKSSLFKEIKCGIVRLQLPKDNFRLLSDRDLEYGHVFKRQLVINECDYFQHFHTEEIDLPNVDSGCRCECDNCNDCYSRRKPLPPTYYVMSIKSDIYRRMFDEVSESKSMPCGLFFCGHHEDVRYPSIMIAVTMVVLLLLVLLLATIFVKG